MGSAKAMDSLQREILARMAAGWQPFPAQLSGLERGLLRRGLVRGTMDDRDRIVLVLTDEGRAFLEEPR